MSETCAHTVLPAVAAIISRRDCAYSIEPEAGAGRRHREGSSHWVRAENQRWGQIYMNSRQTTGRKGGRQGGNEAGKEERREVDGGRKRQGDREECDRNARVHSRWG